MAHKKNTRFKRKSMKLLTQKDIEHFYKPIRISRYYFSNATEFYLTEIWYNTITKESYSILKKVLK